MCKALCAMEKQRDIQEGQFVLPDCWTNDDKMHVLFSVFQPRSLNKESYDFKMQFWKELITQFCYVKGKANFSRQELQLYFMRGELIPACLDTVISEMQIQKEIRLRSDFEYDPQNTWTGWIINGIFKNPLFWSWRKLKHIFVTESQESQFIEWIHTNVMNTYCDKLDAKVLQNNRGKLLDLDSFRSLCEDCEMNVHKEFLPLCLLTLHAFQKIGLCHKMENRSRYIHLIKIPVNEDINISDTDRALYTLHETQKNLLKQLNNLEAEINVNDAKARDCVKDSKRQLAKTYLRKRHLLQKCYERRSIALNNIEILLSSVEDAQNTGGLLEAYKIGTKTLQGILTKSGLQYDNVDEVLGDLRESLDQQREVQDTISNNIVDISLSPLEEDEIEQELRKLNADPQQSDSVSAQAKNNNQLKFDSTHTQLIAMLEDLEVEDGSLSSSSDLTKKLSSVN